MKTALFTLALILSSTKSFADKHEKHHKHHTGAHVHGAMKLEMAVDGKTIELNIEAPAESFVGFEYNPKTTKEKAAWSDAENLWNKDLLSKLFILDATLNCKILESSFKREATSATESHSDIEAKAKIVCEKDLIGQSLSVALKRHFPKIKKLTVDLIGSETKSITIKDKSQDIKL